MLLPNNGSDDGVSGPTTGWEQWLRTAETEDQAAAPAPRTAARAGHNGAKVDPRPTGPAWSEWLQQDGPAEHGNAAEVISTGAAPGRQRRNRRPMVFAAVGAAVAVGAVVAGSVALMSTNQTPAPALPTPAPTPPAVASTKAGIDPVLGGGPGCEATRTPNLVRGNGTGSTASGPDVILAFQHAYYVTRSGAAAWGLVVPDGQVSPVEAIDAGIATIPAGTRYCITITPAAEGSFAVVITETRPGADVRSYQQVVSVTSRDGKTLITQIGRAQ